MGYDVTYTTDLDTHVKAQNILAYKGFLVSGHSEYWTRSMYDAVVKARDGRVSLAFFMADAVYWQVR